MTRLAPAMWDDHERALDVPCPPAPKGCARPAGEPCLNQHTGEPLEHLPAHDARLRAAGVAHAPVDSRELTEPAPRRW